MLEVDAGVGEGAAGGDQAAPETGKLHKQEMQEDRGLGVEEIESVGTASPRDVRGGASPEELVGCRDDGPR